MRIVYLLSLVALMFCATSCVSDRMAVHITAHDVQVSRSKVFGGDPGVILKIGNKATANDVYAFFASSLFRECDGKKVWLAPTGEGRIEILYGDVDYYYRNRHFDIQISCEMESQREKLSWRSYDEDKDWTLDDDSDWDVLFAKLRPDTEMEIRCTSDFPFAKINKICQALVRCGCRRVYFCVVVK